MWKYKIIYYDKGLSGILLINVILLSWYLWKIAPCIFKGKEHMNYKLAFLEFVINMPRFPPISFSLHFMLVNGYLL